LSLWTVIDYCAWALSHESTLHIKDGLKNAHFFQYTISVQSPEMKWFSWKFAWKPRDWRFEWSFYALVEHSW